MPQDSKFSAPNPGESSQMKIDGEDDDLVTPEMIAAQQQQRSQMEQQMH